VAQISVGREAETIVQTAAANQCDMIVMGSAARTPLGSLMAARLSNQLMRLSRTPVTLIRRVGRPSAVACAGIRAVRSAKFGCNHLRYFLQHSSLFPGQTAGFFAVSFATSTGCWLSEEN
jgi:Universal stress protein family